MDLDRPGLAEPVEPADALLEHERRLGEVGADEVVGELEVPPLAAGLAGEEEHRPLGIAEAGDEPVAALERGRVVVEERLEPRLGDAGLQRPERVEVVAEDEHLLAALREAGAELDEGHWLPALRDVHAPEHARGERADLHAPVPDQPGGEAVAVGEVGEERAPVQVRRRAGEHRVVGRELAQTRRGGREVAAGEQLAGDLGVRLVLLEAARESRRAWSRAPARRGRGGGSTRGDRGGPASR